MVVKFGSTNKRHNSTLQPVMDVEYSCTLKEGCSILTPTIKLAKDPDVLKGKNCAYIPSFRRFYWVRDIRIVNAVTYIDLDVDVLATYKSDIGERDLYIVRSAAEFNGMIPDTLYPVTGEVVVEEDVIYDLLPSGNGCYTCGIANADGIEYWAFNDSDDAFSIFMSKLLSDEYTQSVVGTVFEILNPNMKMMVDPLQYITSVKYFPYMEIRHGNGAMDIPVGFGQVHSTIARNYHFDPKNHASALPSPVAGMNVHTYPVKLHPQSRGDDSRGLYLNGSIATDCKLMTPFGTYDLDASIMAQADHVSIILRIDAGTGTGTIIVRAYQGTEFVDLCNACGNMAIDVPIAQVVKGGLDAMGTTATAASMLPMLAAGGAGAAVAVIGAAAGIVSQYSQNAIPKAHITGSQGTYENLYKGIRIQYTWSIVADDHPEDRGRPLCAVRKPKDIPGYLIASDPDIAILGTRDEAEQVNSMLTSGIFYE